MSLPKRDGVQGRYYLIQKPDTNPEVLEHADQCIQDVLDGTAKENHSGYPVVVRNQSGTPFLPSQLLERYLSKLPLKGFPYEDAAAFCVALRRLVGWKEIDHTLGQYIEHQVRDRYFTVGEREDEALVEARDDVAMRLGAVLRVAVLRGTEQAEQIPSPSSRTASGSTSS